MPILEFIGGPLDGKCWDYKEVLGLCDDIPPVTFYLPTHEDRFAVYERRELKPLIFDFQGYVTETPEEPEL